MSAWGQRRQLSFVLIFIFILLVVLAVLIVANRKVPTCSDNLQNQGELGTDCGGPCVGVCEVEANDLIVLWTRVFKVREGIYDIAAYVENPNPFGLTEFKYSMRIFDDANIPVKDVSDSTYMNPNERALIIAPNVNVGFRLPTRAFLSFEETQHWRRLKNFEKPQIKVTSEQIISGDQLSLRALVHNESLVSMGGIELAALLYDEAGNIMHVGRTYVDKLGSAESEEIFFTWPTVLGAASADVLPRVNLVEANILTGDTLESQ